MRQRVSNHRDGIDLGDNIHGKDGHWYSLYLRLVPCRCDRLNLIGSGPISLNVHTGKVDLTPLGGDWETVCIIGPYAANEMAKDLTGHAVDIVTQSEISSSDGIALLITIDAKDQTTLFQRITQELIFHIFKWNMLAKGYKVSCSNSRLASGFQSMIKIVDIMILPLKAHTQ